MSARAKTHKEVFAALMIASFTSCPCIFFLVREKMINRLNDFGKHGGIAHSAA
jgi:hypothetical protein